MSDKLPLEPIARRKTYELIADRLTAQIGERALEPGSPVPPERELVAGFQVGRSSVREALRMLESRGLIESRGNGAFVVSSFRNPLKQSLGHLLSVDEADFDELFEVRLILESESAALAAARRAADHVTALRDAIKEMEQGLGSEERYIAADLRFHLTVADASGNRVLSHLMHAIRDQVTRALGTVYHVPGSPEASLGQHAEIADAIEALRPDDARARMHEHIRRVEHDLHAVRRPRRR